MAMLADLVNRNPNAREIRTKENTEDFSPVSPGCGDLKLFF
jgi:hypothetical protein